MGDRSSPVSDPHTPVSLTDTKSEARAEFSQFLFRRALDSVVTNVMVSDREHNIIYMNETAKQMFQSASAELRSELPDFDADCLIGTNIDAFHRKPMRQRYLLERLDDTYKTQLTVGGRTFRLIANPIINNGDRLGTVVEWSDLTAQLELEEDARRRVDAEHRRKKELMNTIIRELHHRIKNDLQGVVGLLRQSVSNSPENVVIIDDAIKQISAVAAVYNLQAASISLNLKLMDMVNTLVTVASVTKQVQLEVSMCEDDIREFYVSERAAVPLALVITELLTNAVKHSSRSGRRDRILIKLERQASGVRMCICNDTDCRSDMFDYASGSGIGTGLKLVGTLLPEPGSELSFDVTDNAVAAVLLMDPPVLHGKTKGLEH